MMRVSYARIFFTFFLAALLLAATLLGIACVDCVSGESGMGSLLLDCAVKREAPLTLTLTLGKTSYAFDLSPLEAVAGAARDYGVLLLPGGARFALQWGEALRQRLSQRETPEPHGPYVNAALV